MGNTPVDPTKGYGKNIEFISQHDQGGRPDAIQIMVHRGYAYVGNLYEHGFSIIDVRDPREPKTVNFVKAPAHTRTIHLQTYGDLLFVPHHAEGTPESLEGPTPKYSAGLQIYDISTDGDPRPIGFMPVDGEGIHRLYYDGGGRYAYASAMLNGYTGPIFMIIDVSDPTKPVEVGRYHLPGMWTAGGEQPTWGDQDFRLHHPLADGDVAYAAWRDAGFVSIDISDPAHPSLLSQHQLNPPYAGNIHNPLPLKGRGFAVALAEAGPAWPETGKHIWMYDVRDPSNLVSVARFPTPQDRDYSKVEARSGPHQLWEFREGGFSDRNFVFAGHTAAGVRVYDVSDPYRPEETAFYVPPAPTKMIDPRPTAPKENITQTCDVFVDAEGLIYATDYNAGLTIMQYLGS